jgi:hypothetical protein
MLDWPMKFPEKNHHLKLHAAWLVAAVATFGLGILHKSDTAANDSFGASDGTKSQDSSRRNPGNDASSPADRPRVQRPSSPPTDSIIAGLFGGKSIASIKELADMALRNPNQITRRLAFSRLLETMTPDNAEQIRTQLAELGADADQWRDFNFSWGAIAGKSAFDSPSNSRKGALGDTLAGWAAAKPEEALAMFENLPAALEGKREELTSGIVSGLADSNRFLATDLVLRLNQQGNKNAPQLMDLVAIETLRAEGPETAALWSDSLPDGPLKGAAMSRIAGDFARNNPEAAAAWAQRHASAEFAATAIERISGQWTAQNPQAAVGWLESLPAGKGQSAGLQTAFNDWEDRDPATAGQYLLSMPNSPQRDTSISGFSYGYAWQDPQMAIQWAGSISDVNLRQRSLTHAGKIYFSQNPAAARAWLKTSGLATEVQQQITNPSQR